MAKTKAKKTTKSVKTNKSSTKTNTKNIKEEGKVCAILAYFLIGIIWYFVDEKMKKNNFVKYHVKQSLLLMIISIVNSIVFSIVSFLWIIGQLISLGILVLAIIGIINAVNLEEKELPLIGSYANKFFKF